MSATAPARERTVAKAPERWRLKACPKCGGDVFLDDDVDAIGYWETFEECLQCGKRKVIGPGRVVALQPGDEK